MDYNIKEFKFRTHIDWIRFALILPTGERIERTRHDIHSPRDLDNRIAALVKQYHPTEITPVGLELALDAEHGSDDDAALADLVAVMWRMNTADISKNQRIYRTRGTTTAIPKHRWLIAKLREGWQLGEGNKWDDIYRHGYLKVSDDSNRQACPHRARLEIRLQGQACPFATLDELRAFDWTDLAPWFRFRRLKDDIDEMGRIVAGESGNLGKKRPRPRAGEGGTRQFSRITLADDALRDRAYDALRTLNKRWHRAPRQVIDLDTAAIIDREKVGTFEPESRVVTGSSRITTLCEVNNLPDSPANIPPPNTIIAPLPEAQTDRPRAPRRSGGQAERAQGQPFSTQTIERLYGINRDPVTFTESRESNHEEEIDAFLDNLLDEINALPDEEPPTGGQCATTEISYRGMQAQLQYKQSMMYG